MWTSVVVAQGLERAGSGVVHRAPWHVGSPWTRDRAGTPCIARQTLNHWTTREATSDGFNSYNILFGFLIYLDISDCNR